MVATRPTVPIKGMETLAGCRVIWIEPNESRRIEEVVGSRPRMLLVSGWGIPGFNRFRDEVRGAGGRIVGMLDNNLSPRGWKAWLREFLKAMRFRLQLRHKYDYFFVPGQSGRRLLRFYGMPDEKILAGLYAADESLFHSGEALSSRAKTIVYVGQFIERKNVLSMCQAFEAAGGPAAGWRFELYGSGVLESTLRELAQKSNGGIAVNGFLQPEELAEKYRQARAFCLPSVEEHWGLVVHEAALSGCVLLLSDRVGAREDFTGEANVLAFDPFDRQGMTLAFRRLFSLTNETLDAAGEESVRLGREGASVEKFVQSVKLLV